MVSKLIKQEFQKFLIDNNIQGNIIVAVSGGVDSFVLLNLLLEVYDSKKIIVSHINHHARKEADEDEKFLETFCENHDLLFLRDDFYYQKGNFQNEARNARLKFFLKIGHEYKAKYVFLAHHLDDDMENFMMGLIRGESYHKLLGFKMITSFGTIKIVRPFLNIKKEEIMEYAHINNLEYREDSSNASDKYFRNEVRHFLSRVCYRENERFYEGINRYMDLFAYLNGKAKEYIFIFNEEEVDKETNSFKVEGFLKIPSVFQKEVLESLLEETISFKRFREILKQLTSQKPTIEVYSGKYKLVKKNSRCFILSKEESFKLNLVIEKPEEIILPYYGLLEVKSEIYQPEQFKVWYNAERFPFVIRTVKFGDKILIKGGTKKVFRLLMDRKISKFDRKRALVLEKDGVILSVIGFQNSELLNNEEKNLSISLKRCI